MELSSKFLAAPPIAAAAACPPRSRLKKLQISASFRDGFSSKQALVLQVGIGVFALGFIDAGYSGDWSRIGVLTNEAEATLQTAAYLVVPLAIGMIYGLNKIRKNNSP